MPLIIITRVAPWLIWPACLLAHSGLVIAAAVLAPAVLSPLAAATAMALTLVLLVVEHWLPYRADWSVRGDAEIWRDLGHAVAYAGLAVNTARLLFLVLVSRVLSLLPFATRFALWPTTSPVWMQIAIVIVLGDLFEYLYHHAAHRRAFLWRLHAIHHTPVRLHTIKGARHHAGYALGRGVFVWLPLLFLGAPPQLIVWQFIAVTITGLAAHANVAYRIPALLHRVIVTPEFHRVHHADDPRLGTANLAAVLPVWDMLFGTHVDPLTVDVRDAGIRNDPIPRSFVAEMKWPLARRTPDAGA